MKLVKHLLDSKEHGVLSIAPTASVFDAIKLMGEKEIGALIVLEGEVLAGIVTERDYARKVILKGRSSHETPVKDIMTAGVFTTGSDQTVNSCMNLMTDKRIRHQRRLDLCYPGTDSVEPVPNSVRKDD